MKKQMILSLSKNRSGDNEFLLTIKKAFMKTNAIENQKSYQVGTIKQLKIWLAKNRSGLFEAKMLIGLSCFLILSSISLHGQSKNYGNAQNSEHRFSESELDEAQRMKAEAEKKKLATESLQSSTGKLAAAKPRRSSHSLEIQIEHLKLKIIQEESNSNPNLYRLERLCSILDLLEKRKSSK